MTDDSCPHSFSTPNLGGELLAANLGFTGYSESLPSAGYTGCASGTYARKHNPWVNFPAIPSAANQPFTAFPTDYSTLPAVSVVIPNLQNDMHDGSVAQGDSWLQTNMSGYVAWAQQHNSLFILSFDEDDNANANRVATVFAGQRVVPGSYPETINHYSVLRTIQNAYGLAPTGASATAAPILDVWAPPANDQPPVASFTSSCPAATCAFDASGSSDPDGSVVSYGWDFGDGGSATGVSALHAYVASGSYAVSLTVSDDLGATNVVTHQVSATAPANQPFVSDGFNRTVAGGGARRVCR